MIAAATDQHVGDQCGVARPPASTTPGWQLMEHAVAAAGPPGPSDLRHADLRRGPVKHLAAGGACIMQRAAAVWASVARRWNNGLDVRQMSWQQCSVRGLGRRRWGRISQGWRHGGHSSRLSASEIGFQLLRPKAIWSGSSHLALRPDCARWNCLLIRRNQSILTCPPSRDAAYRAPAVVAW